MKCNNCEEILNEEEEENPYKDKKGNILCDECYHDDYCTYCCVCLEPVPDGNVNHFFLFQEDIDDGDIITNLKPGLYKVLKRPFYLANRISGTVMHINPICVERICDASFEEVEDEDHGIEVCDYCAEKIQNKSK